MKTKDKADAMVTNGADFVFFWTQTIIVSRFVLDSQTELPQTFCYWKLPETSPVN